MNSQTLKYSTDSGGSFERKQGDDSYVSRLHKPQTTKVSPREEFILLVLTNSELYGLQIAKAIESTSNGIYEIRVGTLYPTLQKLEEKGLIISRWGDERPDERCGARRRYYRLTNEGKQTVEFLNSFKSKLLAWQPK